MDQQTLSIIKFLIKETPVGHIKSTIDNLKVILGLDLTDNNEIRNELVHFEEQHLRHVNVNDEKIVLSSFNNGNDGFYYDQVKKLKISIEPLNENIEKIETLNKSPCELTMKIDEALKKHIEKNYKSSVTASNIFKKDDNTYNILISAHNYNYKNYWSGEWLGFWTLTNENGKYVLKGTLRLSTYYYEEGNVQFKSSKDYEDILKGSQSDVSSLANEIIKKIENSENDIQSELEKIYDDLSDNYLKPLRRRIPFTGQKMNWRLNQISIGKEGK